MKTKPYSLTLRAVIKDDQGRVLMMKRASGSRTYPGSWELPGGKPDEGEHFADALVREIREETGCESALGDVLGANGWESAKKRIAYLYFEAVFTGGTFKISKEHDDYAWMTGQDVRNVEVSPPFRCFLPVVFERAS